MGCRVLGSTRSVEQLSHCRFPSHAQWKAEVLPKLCYLSSTYSYLLPLPFDSPSFALILAFFASTHLLLRQGAVLPPGLYPCHALFLDCSLFLSEKLLLHFPLICAQICAHSRITFEQPPWPLPNSLSAIDRPYITSACTIDIPCADFIAEDGLSPPLPCKYHKPGLRSVLLGCLPVPRTVPDAY